MLKKINDLRIRFYLLFLLICSSGGILSCHNRESRFIYIISKEDSIYKTLHTRPDGVVLLPPDVRFGQYNFIIDSVNNVYFYSFQEPISTAGVFDGKEDEFAYLMPNHLFMIPKSLEIDFFKKNVVLQNSSEKIKIINVASFSDTIKTDFIKFLKEFQSHDSMKYALKIRRALPEERKVIKFKLEGRRYNPTYAKKDSIHRHTQ
ncbi:hypothetical protein ACUN24_13645 [Pedobacter sp. WC2501]|uniref:hypothetical protein n=1 Tax=Pedobacter sp. WC2501 TaxID=3461400 RepID=UPI0040464386